MCRKLNKDKKQQLRVKLNEDNQNRIYIFINDNGIQDIIQNTRKLYNNDIINQLGLKLNFIYPLKEQESLNIIINAFKHIEYHHQYYIDGYRVDLYFPSLSLILECDEFDHKDRNTTYEKQRQKYIEEKLNCEFIRYNPDDKNFNIGNVINKIIIYNNKIKECKIA